MKFVTKYLKVYQRYMRSNSSINYTSNNFLRNKTQTTIFKFCLLINKKYKNSIYKYDFLLVAQGTKWVMGQVD